MDDFHLAELPSQGMQTLVFDIDGVTKADTLRPTSMHDNEDVENIYNSIVNLTYNF